MPQAATSWRASKAVELLTASPTAAAATDLLAPTTAERAVTAVMKDRDAVWFGRASGHVETVSKMGVRKILLKPGEGTPDNRDAAIRTLAFQKHGRLIAAGSGSGRLAILDRDGVVCLDHDEGPETRITALAFDRRGHWLAAGVSNAVLFIDLRSCKEGPRYPKLEGDALGLRFGEDDDLLVVSSQGRLLRLHERENYFERTGDMRDLAGLWVSAAIDQPSQRIALGSASGAVFLYDSIGGPIGFASVPMHGNPITALAFAADDSTLVSASRDGMVAVWDLSGQSGLSRTLPAGIPDASELRITADGDLTAATTMLGNAGAWRLASGHWEKRIDFEEATREVLGLNALKDADDATLPAPGFTNMDNAIPAMAIDRSGSRVAWSTRRGALLSATLEGSSGPVKIVDQGGGRTRGAMAMSPDGRWLATLSADMLGISVFDLSGSSTPTTATLPDPGRSVVFDERGERLAVGLEGGTVVLFENDGAWRAHGRPAKSTTPT